MKFESWETPEGQKRNKLKVICENFTFVDENKNGNGEAEAGSSSNEGEDVFDSVEETPFD